MVAPHPGLTNCHDSNPPESDNVFGEKTLLFSKKSVGAATTFFCFMRFFYPEADAQLEHMADTQLEHMASAQLEHMADVQLEHRADAQLECIGHVF